MHTSGSISLIENVKRKKSKISLNSCIYIFTGSSIPIPCIEDKTGRVGLEKRGKSNRKSHTDQERGGEGMSTSRKEEEKKRIKMSNKPILLNAFWSLGGGILTHTRWRDINTCHCLLTQLVELILCFSSL